MKKSLILIMSLTVVFSGCSSLSGNQVSEREIAISYTQACSAYGAAFSTALQLRIAGKLNKAQIDQVTMLDAQITPICTGPLPPDPTAATQQIAAAVTSLTILEATKGK